MIKSIIYRFQKYLLSLIFITARLAGIELPPFASASAIIENNQGQFLVVNLSYKKGYSLPGGLLKPNETFEEALLREIKEETDLEVEIVQFIGHYASYDETPTINAVYVATIIDGQIQSSAEGKVSWQNPASIVNNIAYTDNKQAIIEYFNLALEST